MKMNIGERITAALSGIVNLYYEVAETDTTPYAVYSLEYSPSLTKDGPYKYVADVMITVVGKTYDEADAISTSVMAVIEAMKSDDLSVRLEKHTETPDANIWVMQSQYIIQQFL